MPLTTSNPVIVYDDAGRVIDANEAAAQLVGVPRDDLQRMHVRDFYHPDELSLVESHMRSLRLGDEGVVERWLRSKGRYVRVRVKAKRRTIGGYRVEYVLSTEGVECLRLATSVATDVLRSR